VHYSRDEFALINTGALSQAADGGRLGPRDEEVVAWFGKKGRNMHCYIFFKRASLHLF
jgi:hypothetical protein